LIILGAILLILALLPIGLGILLYPGIIILIIGLVLAVAGGTGRPVGGRRHYF
jgi:hypothetical protein